jgi:hypothetical protein
MAYKYTHRGATDEQNGDCSLQINSFENVLKQIILVIQLHKKEVQTFTK